MNISLTKIRFLSFVSLVVLAFFNTPDVKAEPEAVGWLEKARLCGNKLNFKVTAKLDTGAKSSSMHASEIEYFDKDGEPWVRFLFSWKKTRTEHKPIMLEYPIKDTVKIKRHLNDPHERPEIEIPICLGNTERMITVNLIDRSKFNYPILLGRETLKNHYIIDPAKTFETEPECRKEKK